jgi:hypothetical protein
VRVAAVLEDEQVRADLDLGEGARLVGVTLRCGLLTLDASAPVEIAAEPESRDPIHHARIARMTLWVRSGDDSPYVRAIVPPELVLRERERVPGRVRVVFRTSLGAMLSGWVRDTDLR